MFLTATLLFGIPGTVGAVEEEAAETVVLNVVFPTKLGITIDPFELAGSGQIFSDTGRIENLGNTDVWVTFSAIRVNFANDADFEARLTPIHENEMSDRKAIHLLLDFGRENIPPVVVTDVSQPDDIPVLLRSAGHSGSSVALSFSGSVNHSPALAWQSGDVSFSLTYTIGEVVPLSAGDDMPSQSEYATPDIPVVPSVPESEADFESEPAPEVAPETVSEPEGAAGSEIPPDNTLEPAPEVTPETVSEPEDAAGSEAPPDAAPEPPPGNEDDLQMSNVE
jgi:hypothetical protein